MEFKCGHLNEKHFTKSVAGKSVFKDQCGKCFEEPKSKSGILLCLTCFNAFCPAEHLKEHVSAKPTHCLFLRIEMLEKPTPEQGIEITKVGIGIEGGAVGGPEYDTRYGLFCALCEQETADWQSIKPVSGLVKSLIECDSAYKKQSLVQWQLQVQPCEHTLTLQQSPHNKDLSHCGQCDLSSNLWLCLTCGHVGCARRNFDGSGGNGHGVDHFTKTKHPLVVKSGTITAEGNASVHCYQCDEEVQDPELALHLGVLGVNVSERRKTEKTILELTLDANLNLSLSRLVEEGRKMQAFYGPGYTGMDNIGNSCYLNSTVQTLMSLDEYRQQYFVKGLEHLKQCKSAPNDCFFCQIAKVADGLWSGKYSQKQHRTIVINGEAREEQYQLAIKPFDFKMLVAGKHQDFRSSQQQDALEYLQHLFDRLALQQKNFKLENTPNLFSFVQTTRLICMCCHGYKLNENSSNEFKFPVPHPTAHQLEEYKLKLAGASASIQQCKLNEEPEYDVAFDQCLEMLREGDLVEANCPKCGKLSTFRKLSLLKTTPKYLLAVSNRFVLEKWVPKKLNALIKIHQKLDVRPFLAANCKQGSELLKQKGKAQAEPEFSEQGVLMLTDMGFSRNAAMRALSATQNNVEVACGWIYEHIDDKDLNDPLPKKSAKAAQGPPEHLIAQVTDMGFTAHQAKAVLKKYNNNVEAAIGYLFDNGGDISGLMEVEEEQPKELGQHHGPVHEFYDLHAVIVHLGKSVHSGHYVCYIKKHGNWVLYNDSKVSETAEPVLEKGYIYVFKAAEGK